MISLARYKRYNIIIKDNIKNEVVELKDYFVDFGLQPGAGFIFIPVDTKGPTHFLQIGTTPNNGCIEIYVDENRNTVFELKNRRELRNGKRPE